MSEVGIGELTDLYAEIDLKSATGFNQDMLLVIFARTCYWKVEMKNIDRERNEKKGGVGRRSDKRRTISYNVQMKEIHDLNYEDYWQ